MRAAALKWEEALSPIQAKFGSEQEAQIFYTALYHTMVVPNLITDMDGGYRGWDKQVHHSTEGDYYTNYSLWDTYRAVPVIADAILQDLGGFDYELAWDAMKSIAEDPDRGVGFYKQNGFIPTGIEPSSVSKTLEYAYDDWCLEQVALHRHHPGAVRHPRRRLDGLYDGAGAEVALTSPSRQAFPTSL